MKPRLLSIALATTTGFILTLAPDVRAQVIECESRDYQYHFCSTPGGVDRARLVEQRSRSACIEGRSWGYDRRGVWVSGGCSGRFEVQAHRPPPPPAGRFVACESRDYRQEFCPTPDIVGASIVRQKSQSACIEGRTWGWRANGIWVSGGCDADFEIRTAYRPGRVPSGAGRIVCESQEYQYNFCPTGRIRDADLVSQHSETRCIEGQTWGTSRDGVWVDRGCSAEFRVTPR